MEEWLHALIHKVKVDSDARSKLIKGDLSPFNIPVKGYNFKIKQGKKYEFQIKGKDIYITLGLNLDQVAGGAIDFKGVSETHGEISFDLQHLKAISDDPKSNLTITSLPDGSYIFSITDQVVNHVDGGDDLYVNAKDIYFK